MDATRARRTRDRVREVWSPATASGGSLVSWGSAAGIKPHTTPHTRADGQSPASAPEGAGRSVVLSRFRSDRVEGCPTGSSKDVSWS